MVHILTNESRCSLTPFVINYVISDHYPVMVSISCKFTPSSTSQKLVRLFTNFSPDDFNNDLQQRLNSFLRDFSTINQHNLDDIFDKFYAMITYTNDKHAPLTKLSRWQNRLQKRPWLTKGLLISIKRNQKMHKTNFLNESPLEKYFYKLYCNTLTRATDMAKKLYYHSQHENCKHNSKKNSENITLTFTYQTTFFRTKFHNY